MQGMIVDWIGHNAQTSPTRLAPSSCRAGVADLRRDARPGRAGGGVAASLGVERGDRVGVLALNSNDTMDIIFRHLADRRGASGAQLPAHRPELDFIIGNAEPKVWCIDVELQRHGRAPDGGGAASGSRPRARAARRLRRRDSRRNADHGHGRARTRRSVHAHVLVGYHRAAQGRDHHPRHDAVGAVQRRPPCTAPGHGRVWR